MIKRKLERVIKTYGGTIIDTEKCKNISFLCTPKLKDKKVVFVRGYDHIELNKYFENPIVNSFPGLIVSQSFNAFLQHINEFATSTTCRIRNNMVDFSIKKIMVVDDQILFAALMSKDASVIERLGNAPILLKTTPEPNFDISLFSKEEKMMIKILNSIYNISDKTSQDIYINKDLANYRYTDIRSFIEHIKDALPSASIKSLEYTIQSLKNETKRFPAIYIERFKTSIFELFPNAKILGSFYRNINVNPDFMCGDIDILLSIKNDEERKTDMNLYQNFLETKYEELGFENKILALDQGPTHRKFIVPLKNDEDEEFLVRLDVKTACEGSEYFYKKLHQTGSADFNIYCSTKASKLGCKLAEDGLEVFGETTLGKTEKSCNGKKDIVKVTTEDEILQKLNVPTQLIENLHLRNKGIKYDDPKYRSRSETVIALLSFHKVFSVDGMFDFRN